MAVPDRNKKLHITRHANKRIQQRGFTTTHVREMFTRSRLIDDSKYGQQHELRYLYKKYLFVVEENKNNYTLITVFKIDRKKKKNLKGYF